MKFHFEDQPHQAEAVDAVVDLFAGAVIQPAAAISQIAAGSGGHSGFSLDRQVLRTNLKKVTERSDEVPAQTELELFEERDLLEVEQSVPSFSVEMETGTGKTFVYIETALRLARDHGLRKFVILVHSVAIRAGVVKTLQQTQEWFKGKYPTTPYRWSVLGEGPALSDFTQPSSTVQILIASVQSIDKPKSNTLYQEEEQPQLWNEAITGIAELSALKPVVIIDEPQNMATPKRRQAIATLNPLVLLRYSATHKEPYNLIHRLGPKEAMDRALVKRVSVHGVTGASTGKPYLHVRKVRRKGRQLFAEVTMDRLVKGEIRRTEVVLRNDDDLYEESDGHEPYKGMVVHSIERKPDQVTFSGGETLEVGEEIGVDRSSVWKDQIRHTIRQHLQKEEQVEATHHEMKVLSLFFVERVADYHGDEAEIPDVFDALFREEWGRAGRPADSCPDPASVRVAYFPSTKTGNLKDKVTPAQEEELAAQAYEEIISNKELILTRDNPRAFVFSHSALREGWDNPNVFQVCFLRHTRSDLERRQQIGRGLRLPVNEKGHRVKDPGTNRLTLIVDESFDDFIAGLNEEYKAGGWDERDRSLPDNAEEEIVVNRRQEKFQSPEFEELWKRIRYRATYRVSLEGAQVLPAAVAQSPHLDELKYLPHQANIVESGDIQYDEESHAVGGSVVAAEGEQQSIAGRRLPNLVKLVEDQLLSTKYPLMLTRPTIKAIIEALPDRAKRSAVHNPEGWARIVSEVIRRTTIEEMVSHIRYDPTDRSDWWDADVVFLRKEVFQPATPIPGKATLRGVTDAPEQGSNLFDKLVYDSGVERDFGELLETDREHVKLFTKLPRRFHVRTPVGDYHPDWAIVYARDGVDRIYLVRETKDEENLKDLDWDEAMRILFGERHFDAAPAGSVHFTHTTRGDIKVPREDQHQK